MRLKSREEKDRNIDSREREGGREGWRKHLSVAPAVGPRSNHPSSGAGWTISAPLPMTSGDVFPAIPQESKTQQSASRAL